MKTSFDDKEISIDMDRNSYQNSTYIGCSYMDDSGKEILHKWPQVKEEIL